MTAAAGFVPVRIAEGLERGRFIWPQAREGRVALSPAQLSMLLEGIDWRAPLRTDCRTCEGR